MKRILLVTSLLSIAAQTPVHAASQLANVATAGSTQETAKSLWSAITQDAKTIWNQQNTPSQVAAWANDPVTKAVGQKFSNAAATDAQALGKAADEAAKQYGHLVPPVIAGVSLITAGMSAKGLYTFAKNKKTFGSCVKAITSTAVLGGSLFALYISAAEMLRVK